MATTATAPAAAASSNPEDVRAAALAVLRIAEERTEKGQTAAKHRSPLPTTNNKRLSSGNNNRRSSSNSHNNKNIAPAAAKESPRNSFNLFQWGKKQMEDVKESMNQLDEKFLKLQFEQEEKFRKAYDKTATDLSGIFSSPNKNKAAANTNTNTPANTPQQQQPQPPNELQNAMSRFRTSFTGFTKKLTQPEPVAPVKPPSLDEQIVAELEQLHEQMTLCHSLLAEKDDLINQIDYDPDPRLPYTIKKLEAALPRMDQLMEAGIDGQFHEDDTTQICVSTYERLILTLEKCNSPLVKSNAFAFTKDLEGDDEFDEAAASAANEEETTTEANNTSTLSNASSTGPQQAADAAKENPFKQEKEETAAAPAAKEEEEDLALDGLDADLDIDLAAFEIGDDDDEDHILNTSLEDEKKTDSSPSSDDDFIKDMFE